MTTMYTDRLVFSFNGVPVIQPGDVFSVEITEEGNASFVNGMTPTGNASGGVKGNNSFQIRLTQLVQNNKNASNFDFSVYDYETNNAEITFTSSSNSYGPEHIYEGRTYIYSGVFYMNAVKSFAGQGQSATITYIFGATNKVEV